MRQFDTDRLRKELISIYTDYLRDPADIGMKKRARMLHTAYGNSGPSLDRPMRHAINTLVEVGWDLPAPPKPTRDEVKKLLFLLASRNA